MFFRRGGGGGTSGHKTKALWYQVLMFREQFHVKLHECYNLKYMHKQLSDSAHELVSQKTAGPLMKKPN